MALIMDNLQFIKETSLTEGDMTPGISPPPVLELEGPADGFESIASKVGAGHTTYLTLRHNTAWMRFLGTVLAADQVRVEEILNSSDGGNPLVLGPGTKYIYTSIDEHFVRGLGTNVMETPRIPTGVAFVIWSGLPTGIKSVHLSVQNLSTASDDTVFVRLSKGGGLVVTGYVGSVIKQPGDDALAETVGFPVLKDAVAAGVYHGQIQLARAFDNVWNLNSQLIRSSTVHSHHATGWIDLGAELDGIWIMTEDAGNFDSGAIGLQYQR